MTKSTHPKVVMETSEGKIVIALWADKAPVTVKNFLRYTDEKFYDGTVFHRVIGNFMIQGGGMTADMQRKATHEPIKNEASAELKNARGTVAMARTQAVDSATSQFFINVVDNAFLNHKNETPRGFGYAVFGEVVEGMDVVDKIKNVKTTVSGPYRDVPATPVVIKSVRRLASE
jgi:peptidyl-prolyl cis-trans isomerase B (cyclophilin B)